MPPDPMLLTAIENTVKFIRYVRCKNENLHAALKQKFKILDSELPSSYLLPFFQGKNVTHYTVLSVVCCSLYNIEHPGFPVRWLKEDQKVWKAQQIHKLINVENFLQYIDMTQSDKWEEIKDLDDVETKYNFPQLTAKKLQQVFEVIHGIHPIRRAVQVASYLRKKEVDENYVVEDFDHYLELLDDDVEDLQLYVMRLDRPPRGYNQLASRNILPEWSGNNLFF